MLKSKDLGQVNGTGGVVEGEAVLVRELSLAMKLSSSESLFLPVGEDCALRNAMLAGETSGIVIWPITKRFLWVNLVH